MSKVKIINTLKLLRSMDKRDSGVIAILLVVILVWGFLGGWAQELVRERGDAVSGFLE